MDQSRRDDFKLLSEKENVMDYLHEELRIAKETIRKCFEERAVAVEMLMNLSNIIAEKESIIEESKLEKKLSEKDAKIFEISEELRMCKETNRKLFEERTVAMAMIKQHSRVLGKQEEILKAQVSENEGKDARIDLLQNELKNYQQMEATGPQMITTQKKILKETKTSMGVSAEQMTTEQGIITCEHQLREMEAKKGYPHKGRSFREQLIKAYLDDESFQIGIEATKFLEMKGLKADHTVLTNQFVTVITISKKDDPDSQADIFALGYANDEDESFARAVEDIKNNRYFQKYKKIVSKGPAANPN